MQKNIDAGGLVAAIALVALVGASQAQTPQRHAARRRSFPT